MAEGDIYRLDVLWQESGGVFVGENVLHYRQGAGQIEATPADDLGAAAREVIVPAIAGILSTTYQSVLSKVRGVTNPTEGVDEGYTAIPGTRSGTDTYARTNGALVSWRTGLIGKAYRGRTYFLATVEGDITSSGFLSSGYVTLVGAMATTIMNVPSTTEHGAWDLVVLSRFLNKVERPTPIATPVTTFVVRPYTGIQRGRRD